jgi:hypothetical protein
MVRMSSAFASAALIAALCLSLATPAVSQTKPEAGDAKPVAPAKPQIPPLKKKGETPNPALRAECAWTGQRIVALLWRDDVNTAREQSRFYEMFGCPAEHLPVAFRCVIRQSESQPEQNDLNARVYGCWMSPEIQAAEE